MSYKDFPQQLNKLGIWKQTNKQMQNKEKKREKQKGQKNKQTNKQTHLKINENKSTRRLLS